MENFEEISKFLDTKIGGKTIRDLNALEFYQFILKKIDGQNVYSPVIQEIVGKCYSPLSKFISDEEKIEIFYKFKKLNIEI